jgi:hypothetical protein
MSRAGRRGLLVAAFGQLLVRLPVGPLAAAGLMVGLGGVTAIVWEIGEYYTFIRDSPEVETAYTDTLGDMALGLAGSVLTAAIAAAYASAWSRRSRSPSDVQ